MPRRRRVPSAPSRPRRRPAPRQVGRPPAARAAPVAHADRPGLRGDPGRHRDLRPLDRPARARRVRRRARTQNRGGDAALRRRLARPGRVEPRFLYGGRTILVTRPLVRRCSAWSSGIAIGLVAAYAAQRARRPADARDGRHHGLPADHAGAGRGQPPWAPRTGSSSLAIALTTMPRVARVPAVRRRPVVERDFVAAAESIGVSRDADPVQRAAPEHPRHADGRGEPAADLLDRRRSRRWPSSAWRPTPTRANWGPMIKENQTALSAQPWGALLPDHRHRPADHGHRPHRRRHRAHRRRHRPRAGDE